MKDENYIKYEEIANELKEIINEVFKKAENDTQLVILYNAIQSSICQCYLNYAKEYVKNGGKAND